MVSPNQPSMNSRLVSLFLIRFPDGPLQWFSRIDYRSTPTTQIVFEDVPQALRIAIDRRYVERLGAIIGGRIQDNHLC